MPEYKIKRLKEVNFNFSNKIDSRYDKNWELLKQCVNEGYLLSPQNRNYKDVNLYNWVMTTVKKRNEEVTDQQKMLIEQVLKGHNNIPINLIDVISNKVHKYQSIHEGGRALKSVFHVVNSEKTGISAIHNHLIRKAKSPYKGRFRFEYADTDATDKISS